MRFLKSALPLFFLLLVFNGAIAQSPGPLRLQSGDLPTTSFSNLQNEFYQTLESFSGKRHYIIQFYSVPDAETRTEMKAAGIQLLDYLPEMAWVASIDSRADIVQLKNRFHAYAVIPYQYGIVVSRKLMELPLPFWAVKQPGTIDITLSYFSDLQADEVKAALAAMNFHPLEEFDYGNYLTLRVSPDQIPAIAQLPFVSYLEPISPDPAPENYSGRTLHRSNAIASDYATGRHYDGTGVVVAMGDDGIIGPHIDYQGRVDNSRVNNNDGNHGDHVGGTIMGAGNLNPKNKGMAFGATLEVYDVWDAVNQSPVDHVQDSVIITSTSYSDGCNAGYTSFARSADRMMRQNPKLIHVFSAGNDGTSDCGYGAGVNWGNITGGVKIGKNVITVGNLNANDGLDASSSRGPVNDGRIKPEVCAKGTNVTSTIDPYNYASFSGTSMSCPGTSGTIAQINQAYRELNGGQWAPSGLIKAILMNTADDLGNAGPDFKHGFGRINALRSVQCLEQVRYMSDSLAQAETDSFTINVPAGTAELRVMLYWHDYEGANMASVALVNNLNLQVTDPGNNTYNPWVLDHTPNAVNLNTVAVRGLDNLNNQEQVTVAAPAAGTWKLKISSVLIPQGPQEYFITYEILDSSVTVTWPMGGEALVPGETELIRWDAVGNSGTFGVELSVDSGATWSVLNAAVNGSQKYLSWVVPATITGKALMKVTRGAYTDVSDSTFSMMTVPSNLQIFRACPTNTTLKWNSLANAQSYDVYQLGQRYMDFIGNTTADTFVIGGLSSSSEYWFAVSANGADNANGRRCNAIQKTPGVLNCLEPNDVAVDAVSSPPQGSIADCAFGGTQPVVVTLRNYSPNASTGIPVSYKLNNNAVVTETFTGTLPAYGTAQHTFSVNETFVQGNTYTLLSWTGFPADANSVNDTVTSVTSIVPGTTVSTPFAQDFENFTLCSTASNCTVQSCALNEGWANGSNATEDAIDWRPNAGTTPTGSSGPDQDHNPGTSAGKYLYLEASSCFEREGRLLSPCIDLTTATSPQLTFWMHLYGTDMGSLHVDLFSNGAWTEDVMGPFTTDWSNVWWQQTLNLTPWAGEVIILRWRGITGEGPTSDMAIDDINITDLNEIEGQLLSTSFRVYPVPGDGNFTLECGSDDFAVAALSVNDMLGRTVHSATLSNVHPGMPHSLDLRELPRGIYFLTVSTAAGNWNQRLVIQ